MGSTPNTSDADETSALFLATWQNIQNVTTCDDGLCKDGLRKGDTDAEEDAAQDAEEAAAEEAAWAAARDNEEDAARDA